MNNAPSYPIASLYVGDLLHEVTEAMLFERFSTAGERLCASELVNYTPSLSCPNVLCTIFHRPSIVYPCVP